MYVVNAVAPKVSIGLPVFDGENFLVEALESHLAQTFEDYELIICDNASTDDTAQICEQYAKRDRRIRYHRNEENIGPCRNFDLAVELANARYFKWSAHDDLLAPDFLEKCVAALDDNPASVLSHSLTRIIDEEGKEIAVYDSHLEGARVPVQSRRFASLILTPHICVEMFGLMRTEALRNTRRLEGNYHGCDRAMLAELALVGSFEHIPEPLFLNREHARRYVRAVQPKKREAFHAARNVTPIGMVTWWLYHDYIRSIGKHSDGFGNRLRCYGHLILWWFVSWNSMRVGSELIAQVFPGFYEFAKRMKNQYIRPAHPVVGQDERR